MASYEKHPEIQPEDPKAKHGGLKIVLAIAVVVLVVIAIAVGLLVWQNSSLTDAHQTDTEVLNQSKAGVNDTTFQATDIKGIPAYSKIYGKTFTQIKGIKGSKLSFTSGLAKSGCDATGVSAEAAAKVKYKASASVADANGATANIYFDKKRKAVAIQYMFDLDALGVAEADFAVYVNSRIVPASLMMSVGFSDVQASDSAISTDVDPEAIQESSSLRTATYTGETGARLKTVTKVKKVYNKKKHKKIKKKIKKQVQVDFMYWQLQQAYRYGGSGTTRTCTISMW